MARAVEVEIPAPARPRKRFVEVPAGKMASKQVRAARAVRIALGNEPPPSIGMIAEEVRQFMSGKFDVYFPALTTTQNPDGTVTIKANEPGGLNMEIQIKQMASAPQPGQPPQPQGLDPTFGMSDDQRSQALTPNALPGGGGGGGPPGGPSPGGAPSPGGPGGPSGPQR